jgi:hypothetical protein
MGVIAMGKKKGRVSRSCWEGNCGLKYYEQERETEMTLESRFEGGEEVVHGSIREVELLQGKDMRVLEEIRMVD